MNRRPTLLSSVKVITFAIAFSAALIGRPSEAEATTIYAAPNGGGLGINPYYSFGEVFTVSSPDTVLTSFAFGLDNYDSNVATYFGYLYAWDSSTTSATGSALFSGTATQPPYSSPGFSGYVAFAPQLQLVAGQQYIAIMGPRTNAGQQFLACGTGLVNGCVNNPSPSTLFYRNLATNFTAGSQWVPEAYRVAFNITLDAPTTTAPVPEPGTLVLFATGAALMLVRIRRHR